MSIDTQQTTIAKMLCLNCNSTTHGFKQCPQVSRFCKKCKSFGHPERRCDYLWTLCWFCAEVGTVHKGTCPEHKQIKSCGVMMIDEDHKIFCVQSAHAKVWSLPKGHQQTLDEAYHVCAMREVFEETNIKLQLKEDSQFFSYQKRRYFVVKIKNNMKRFLNVKLQSDEVVDYKWIHHSELDKFKTNCDLQHIKNKFDELI